MTRAARDQIRPAISDRLLERRAALLALHKAVEHVAGLEVFEAVERDAALHPLGHLGDAVLEVLQRLGGQWPQRPALASS